MTERPETCAQCPHYRHDPGSPASWWSRCVYHDMPQPSMDPRECECWNPADRMTHEQIIEARDTKIAMLQGVIRSMTETAAENSRIRAEDHATIQSLHARVQDDGRHLVHQGARIVNLEEALERRTARAAELEAEIQHMRETWLEPTRLNP